MSDVTILAEQRPRLVTKRLLAEFDAMLTRCRYLRRVRRDCPWLDEETWMVIHGEGGSSVEEFYLANREGVWRPFAVVFLHQLYAAASDPAHRNSEAGVVVEKYATPAFQQARVRFRAGSLAA